MVRTGEGGRTRRVRSDTGPRPGRQQAEPSIGDRGASGHMTRPAFIALLAGVLPIVAAHLAYLMNVHAAGDLAPEFICMPYTEGCVSISRAARSGPGLPLFRAVMLPTAALMLISWELVREWLTRLGACRPRRACICATITRPRTNRPPVS